MFLSCHVRLILTACSYIYIDFILIESFIYSLNSIFHLIRYLIFFSLIRYYTASSKTLTSGPSVAEQPIADGALTEQRITPAGSQLIPENNKKYESQRSTMAHPETRRSTCLFNDLFFISKWSINRYIWKQIMAGKATKFIELSVSFPYKLTPLSLIILLLDFHDQKWLGYWSPVRILTTISEVTFTLQITICKTIGFLKSTNCVCQVDFLFIFISFFLIFVTFCNYATCWYSFSYSPLFIFRWFLIHLIGSFSLYLTLIRIMEKSTPQRIFTGK